MLPNMDAPPNRLKEALAYRYPLERELGRGGMAIVYLGRDLKHDRPVAVKVLRSEYSEGLGGGRFLREIDIAARMTHPHILPLHDSGEAGGFLYSGRPPRTPRGGRRARPPEPADCGWRSRQGPRAARS